VPARLLEIISPAGFEHYFEELAALLAAGGPPDPASRVKLARKYDLDVDMDSVMRLSQTYHISLASPGYSNR
jgi:hypothetical protein